ncbi:MAG: cytochrome c3 family protein [Blastocatellia bacterium]|nr:cytochrome c3 family protein [Blastocatellia bacterium]
MFPKWTNKAVKIGLLFFALAGAGVAGAAGLVHQPSFTDVGYSPEQPVPFSHKLHAGDMGMDCRFCHTSVEQSAVSSVPPTQTCMVCHTRVRTDSKLLLPVRESFASGKPVEWVKIHKLPDFAYFNHKAHVSSGVSCVSCHGRVDQMQEVAQVQPLNMSWCLDCHRNPAPNIRPKEFVTKLDWVPPRDPVEIGRELVKANKINPPVNCGGCHR